MKKMTLLVVASTILVLLVANPVQADNFYWCTVSAVGPSGAYVGIRLTDNGGSFTNIWYRAGDDQAAGNRILAIALTALAEGQRIYVGINETVSPKVVRTCYLWP